MKKMSVVLLCGYRRPDSGEKALFQSVLDSRIRQLRWLGYNVVCVVAGEFADDQLRYCPQIANCELVFDTQDEPNLATNLKAGLAGTDGSGCFVLPVEIPIPPREDWEEMRERWRANGFLTETNIYKGVASHFGFPLLVTRKGNSTIRDLTDFRSLTDKRLKYEDLASLEQPL